MATLAQEIIQDDERQIREVFPVPETQESPKMNSEKLKEGPPIIKNTSGIPLRRKTATNKTKSGYQSKPPNFGPIVNKNTLEMQFLNNKKRLLQLHAELVNKQRPLVEMHKSLMRTKKQLESLGKKVELQDLKVISLKIDEPKDNLDGSGETPATETALNLKSSIENALETCAEACKKCFGKRDHLVDLLENAAKSDVASEDLKAEIDELKREKDELEVSIVKTIKDNEKKIEGLITNWERSFKVKDTNEESSKIAALEETVKQQQKIIAELDDNAHSLNRKLDDKKAGLEKTMGEMQEKLNKLDEELKKERKNANDNLMKTRTMRGKLSEMESKARDAEEKYNVVNTNLKQLQESSRKKEVQWMREKEELKQRETKLQQKFSEKQSQFDTRLKDFEEEQKRELKDQVNFKLKVQQELTVKEDELMELEREKDDLEDKSRRLEEHVQVMKRSLEEKDKQIESLSRAAGSAVIESRIKDDEWNKLMEHKAQIVQLEKTINDQNEQISKMQSSLKAHAKLAAALKMEKDNAAKYSSRLRDILQEARDEIQHKNKTIYKIHEKLVVRDHACEKLKAELKKYDDGADYPGDGWGKDRCQICMTSLYGNKSAGCSSCIDSEVGKSSAPKYVSESLIGMSVRKVDHLRTRIDNLKNMKIPIQKYHEKYSCSRKAHNETLQQEIARKGKLYKILQQHADQSCEDFINLLKLTVSNQAHELKPSNDALSDDDTFSDDFAYFEQKQYFSSDFGDPLL